jgi:hypothetical protein
MMILATMVSPIDDVGRDGAECDHDDAAAGLGIVRCKILVRCKIPLGESGRY